jgi:hypothetical protein
MQTLWVREHNRLVRKFEDLGVPERFGWTCEELYQRVRRYENH